MKTIKMISIILISIVMLIGIAGFFILRLPQFGKTPAGEHLNKISTSDQYNASKNAFENDGGVAMKLDILKMVQLLPEFFLPKAGKQPNNLKVMHPSPEVIGSLEKNQSALTWFGHSAFVLEMDEKVILLDPMFGPSAAPFSFQVKRFTQDLPIAVESLPQIDAVIFSHDHYDHLDYSTIQKIKTKVKHFYVPLGLGSHLRHWGVAEDQITELDWWESAQLGGMELVCTPSQHFSGRGIGDGGGTLWSSWVIQTQKHKLFFSGDSGYFKGFKEIGERFGPFDIALLECGQYNENWIEIHMLPEQSAQAAVDLRAECMLPIHWGMFDLALHTWTDPIERVSKEAAHLGMPVISPRIGERFTFDHMPQDNWWKED